MHLVLAQPAKQLVATFGEHGATKAWLPVGSEDPWHRDGAFFGWDAVGNQRATQERRVYMSGLSDEAGAGAGLAMAVKQLGAPSAAEVGLLEQYVQHTLYQGDHPDRSRFLQGSAHHDVRLSMLYWTDEMSDQSSAAAQAAKAAAPELARVCKGCWPKSCSWMDCWSESHSLETWRSYNYPHVTAVYWSLYRLGRWHSPPLTRRQPWQWYLRRAHKTALALWTHGGDPWTNEHLVDGFAPCWQNPLSDGTFDSALCNRGTSRWANFYVEGLRTLLRAPVGLAPHLGDALARVLPAVSDAPACDPPPAAGQQGTRERPRS